MNDDDLYALARAAANAAYCPYSGISVGAAIDTGDGKVYTGCNVESASYGLTLCAERGALATAVAAGRRRFHRVAVAMSGAGETEPVPCGACLQFLAEFGDENMQIITAPGGGRPLSDFLPRPFRLSR